MGGGAVQICDTLRIGAVLCHSTEVGQAGAFVGRLLSVYEVDLGRAEQENLCRKTVRPGGDSLSVAGTGTVRDLDLLDCLLNVRVEHRKEGAIEVRMDSAVCVVVDIRAVPLTVFINVFH